MLSPVGVFLFVAFFHPVSFFQPRQEVIIRPFEMTSASMTRPMASPTLKQIILTTLASPFRNNPFNARFITNYFTFPQ